MRLNFSVKSAIKLLRSQFQFWCCNLLTLRFAKQVPLWVIATGIAGAGSIIPIVLAAFVGSRAIDYFGAWRVSVTADVLSSVSVLLLPIVFLKFNSVSPIVIFLLVFVGALFDLTATAARQTLASNLIVRKKSGHLELWGGF
ncbi:MAG: hypothetical protein HC780_01345 [Leptolyngbyaceae cyanobacterium CSU_1_3]|nr:hypothetical protein [Leptolyngbyaceae cyanobacterium CSU_1_3]